LLIGKPVCLGFRRSGLGWWHRDWFGRGAISDALDNVRSGGIRCWWFPYQRSASTSCDPIRTGVRWPATPRSPMRICNFATLRFAEVSRRGEYYNDSGVLSEVPVDWGVRVRLVAADAAGVHGPS
jgi:hypothetical protein